MRAVYFEAFGGPVEVRELPDPSPPPDGVVVRVEATGVCRSDWHGWMGHDAEIRLPHVPGHELAGTIVEVGPEVRGWRAGDRVVMPFISACGACAWCLAGEHQVCDAQVQPGFAYWGSFAERVALHHADVNLVRLPDEIDFVTAASLGCRFATARRAVVGVGRVKRGEWVAIHGCGGVGLSAVMIAVAAGARVVAVDVSKAALDAAMELGATATIDASVTEDIPARVIELTAGGAHLSIDALGGARTAWNSIAGLRKRGRHVQVGLLLGPDAEPRLPIGLVISRELEILGSHGMAPRDYAAMLADIASGRLDPARLVGRTVSLEEAPAALMSMDAPQPVAGMTVILPNPGTIRPGLAPAPQ